MKLREKTNYYAKTTKSNWFKIKSAVGSRQSAIGGRRSAHRTALVTCPLCDHVLILMSRDLTLIPTTQQLRNVKIIVSNLLRNVKVLKLL
jgi:hypothetical protein